MFRGLILFTLLAIYGFAYADNELGHYKKLANSGAKQLAISGLLKIEPDKRFEEQRWLAWLAEIVALYEWNEDWQAAAKLLRELPADINPETRRWAETKRVTLALKQGEPNRARRILQQLLWRPALEGQTVYRQPQASWPARWRRLLIETYLADKRFAEAAAAMRLYRQDYAVEAFIDASGSGLQKFPENYQSVSRGRMAELETRIAVALGDFSTALRAAEQGDTELLRLLRQYALMVVKPKELLRVSKALKATAKSHDDLVFRKSTNVLLAKAYALLSKPGDEVAAIIAAISIAPLDAHVLTELEVPDDWYWRNISAIGAGLSQAYFPNMVAEQRLLKVTKVGNVFERIAIYLRLAQGQGNDFANRALIAAFKDAKAAGVDDSGILRLFTEVVPADIQKQYSDQLTAKLVDVFMARNDLAAASKSLLTMSAGSVLKGDFNWHLRRARIHLLGGQPVLGAKILAELLLKDLTAAEYDQLLQVIFDVQTVGLHDYALDLLLLMQPKQAADKQRQREMWYWIAEAHKALGQNGDAAAAYLLSADFLQDNATDQWAVSARLSAAEQLVEAGFAEDAQGLYEFLLLTARKDNVRAMLRTKIQRLSVENF